jgi:hypothetical protein
LEDVIVSIDLEEYPTDFRVLHPNTNLGGYPIILGFPWLETTHAYIGCHFSDITIFKGGSMRKLILHPPSKSILDLE